MNRRHFTKLFRLLPGSKAHFKIIFVHGYVSKAFMDVHLKVSKENHPETTRKPPGNYPFLAIVGLKWVAVGRFSLLKCGNES